MITRGPKTGLTGNINYSTVQLAKIKSTSDKNHSGRLKVWLMASNSDENDESNWLTVKYASPFAGISNPSNVDSEAVESTSGTQKSYGFFAVPPDTENVVLVTFANADPTKGYWFSSTYADTMTKMVPSRAGGNTYQGGGKPSAEVNRYSQQTESPASEPIRPELDDNSSALDEQGLADDPLLGPGESSVWRDESPTVMGWLSPSGNQIVIDDKDGYQLIRLRTPSGVQILLSETTGDIFINNKAGSGWIRVGNSGDVDLFSSKSFNVFGGSDINLKSGGNINLEAGGEINVNSPTVNIGNGTVNLKGTVNSSFINADVAYANTAGAAPFGAPSPVGDTAGPAGTVSRTPTKGGKTS